MPTGIRNAMVGGLLAGALAVAWAQAGAGIYTCVDGKGRRLTSDRPITECADREQRILGSSGTQRGTLGPMLSPAEQTAQAEREKRLAEERQREADAKRMDRLLVARYPNAAVHDAERAKALLAVQYAVPAGPGRAQEEEKQRVNARFDQELAKLRVLWAQAQGVPSADLGQPIRR